MEKPKIIAVKHKQLSTQRAPLTELEKSLAEEIRKRGEELPEELQEQLEEEEPAKKAFLQAETKEATATRVEDETSNELEEEGEKKGETEQPSEQAAEGQKALEEKKAAAQERGGEKKAEAATEEQSKEKAGAASGGEKEKTEAAGKPGPKIIARKEYLPAAPAHKKPNLQQVRDDIVKEMREQAGRDILQVRKEIGKPITSSRGAGAAAREERRAEEIVREIGEEDPHARKKKLVDEAIRKFEENEGGKSLVRKLMKSFGFK